MKRISFALGCVYGLVAITDILFTFSNYEQGRFLFVLSDSMLAVNRFIYPFPILPPVIMLTYCSAQFLLVAGSIRHLRSLNII
ncbi:MAG TPA: lysoplasmalogenase family protein [Agriterribacter sp.]|nr:lysoplasmalogenase family protein [Agriterribacter sp.]HRQ49840.1 lysoplasmalogenase family protein [Agriterribacter sp.]